MAHRIEISFKIPDTRPEVRKKSFARLGIAGRVEAVFWNDVYTIDHNFSKQELEKIAAALANPLIERFKIDVPLFPENFSYAIEVGFLPGVTDNVGHTAKETIEDLLKIKFPQGNAVYTSQVTFLQGNLSQKDVKIIADSLYNPLIQRVTIKSFADYKKDGGMGIVIPQVRLEKHMEVMEVDLDLSDECLGEIGKKGIKNSDGSFRGPLALSLDYMKLIRDYFKEKEGRNPHDIELESIAQTWSEHCKHTIFASPIDEIEDGLYRHYIKRATNEIRAERTEDDICVSVFSDNSGGIAFDEDWIVTDKVETHNSPSALDPFGGAITGIVGVNRDCIGFGKGAKPVINRYGFCFADPDDREPLYKDKDLQVKMLPPKRILEGVIAGVNAGGNQSGIPTPCGFLYFDERYKGKPLVYCGTIGLIPRKINGRQGWEKKAQPGDLIVVIGGKVGQDGIHGATFSSEAMDSGSPATAVQIGDPITQKKFSDALVKEAQALDLYNSITDCGAGGISCSVAEMAKESGGFHVELEKVPLKYPNLEPWKIWISESQERMTLAVPEKKWQQFRELLSKRGVEAWVIGTFTDSGRCEVDYRGRRIMDMEMKFLHEGLTYKPLKTEDYKVKHPEPKISEPEDYNEVLRDMMSRLNICSFDFVSYQYDYIVQGGAVLQPLQGKGKVNANCFVYRPVLSSPRGVILSHALCPAYSDIDTYHMAACAIDSAIRNAVSGGVSLDHLALLDNFCWCSSEDPRRLKQLKEAAKACYDYAKAFGTPFISGKDSMFNDFRGFDKNGRKVLISVPPTLLLSSIGVVNDVQKCVSMDVKMEGDLIYVLGKTRDELGGSEYFACQGEKEGVRTVSALTDRKGYVGNKVPKVDSNLAKNMYQTFYRAVEQELIASAHSVALGGLAIALVKSALAGQLGLEIDLSAISSSENVDRDDQMLFSESQSRFVVTIDPANREKFEKIMKGLPCECVGKVVNSGRIILKGIKGKKIVDVGLEELDKGYRSRFAGY